MNMQESSFSQQSMSETEREALLEKARLSGDPYKDSGYFREAEWDMQRLWDNYIWPVIKDLDFTSVLDLACGHGRNSVLLRPHVQKLVLVDINQECVDACQERFKGDDAVTILKTDGISLEG